MVSKRCQYLLRSNINKNNYKTQFILKKLDNA